MKQNINKMDNDYLYTKLCFDYGIAKSKRSATLKEHGYTWNCFLMMYIHFDEVSDVLKTQGDALTDAIKYTYYYYIKNLNHYVKDYKDNYNRTICIKHMQDDLFEKDYEYFSKVVLFIYDVGVDPFSKLKSVVNGSTYNDFMLFIEHIYNFMDKSVEEAKKVN